MRTQKAASGSSRRSTYVIVANAAEVDVDIVHGLNPNRRRRGAVMAPRSRTHEV